MLNDWRIFHKQKKDFRIKQHNIIDQKITVENIKNEFEGCSDIRYKEIYLENGMFTLVYIEGMVLTDIVDENILKPIIYANEVPKISINKNLDIFSKLEKGLIPHVSSSIVTTLDKVISSILNGEICLIDSDKKNKAIVFDTRKIEKRSITEPNSENIVKGSKESFIEALRVNISLIRTRLKTPDLKINEVLVGKKVLTRIAILYMDSVVDRGILEKVTEKIKNINTDKLVAPADFEEQIIDNKYNIFPQLIYTEKTDKVVSDIVEGKISVIIDGLPIVYILPSVFPMFFQAPEDYSFNFITASIIRFIRYLCAFLSLALPAFYVSITTFHREMIPFDLAVSITNSKEGEPFPVVIEVIFMLLSFEILIEASKRLPKTIGQSISIIGGLIVGQAAVSAKFVSPSVVVTIAIAGLTGFLIPNQDFSNSLRLCRFIAVIFSAYAGLYGLSIALILIIYYMSTIESFGIPYFAPIAGNDAKNLLKDTLIRAPLIDMKKNNKTKE